MDLLERAKQKLEESKKVHEEKIISGEKDKKVAHAPPEKKKIFDIKSSKKNSKMGINAQFDPQIIDQKINEKFNKVMNNKIVEFERDLSKNALELMSIGAEHKLTEENIINYFKKGKKQKKYGLYDIFTPHDTRKVDNIVNKLLKESILKRDRNNWYSLK